MWLNVRAQITASVSAMHQCHWTEIQNIEMGINHFEWSPIFRLESFLDSVQMKIELKECLFGAEVDFLFVY